MLTELTQAERSYLFGNMDSDELERHCLNLLRVNIDLQPEWCPRRQQWIIYREHLPGHLLDELTLLPAA